MKTVPLRHFGYFLYLSANMYNNKMKENYCFEAYNGNLTYEVLKKLVDPEYQQTHRHEFVFISVR